MRNYSTYDLTQDPPVVMVPRSYNVAVDFVDRRVDEGFAGKVAFIDDNRQLTYGELQSGVNRFGNALRGLGLQAEQRVLMLQLDSVDFPVVFFGAIKAGMVAAWFMHMDIEKKIVWFLMAVTCLCMLIFFSGVAPDVMNTEGDNWENTRTVGKIPGE